MEPGYNLAANKRKPINENIHKQSCKMRAWCGSEETEDLIGELEDSAMPTLDATRPSVHFVHQSNAMNVVNAEAKVSHGISSLCYRVECIPKLFSKLRNGRMVG